MLFSTHGDGGKKNGGLFEKKERKSRHRYYNFYTHSPCPPTHTTQNESKN